MNIEQIREYCLGKPHAYETLPFDELTLVYKLGTTDRQKVFAMISMDNPEYLMVKCDPERAVELRERYPDGVEPAYHCDKKHWNGIFLHAHNGLTDQQIREFIDHSHGLVLASLPKKIRLELGE